MSNIKRVQNFHTKTLDETYHILDSSDKGIASDTLADRVERYGKNVIEHSKKKSLILTFFKQFHNAMIYILLVAAGISCYFDHLIDVYVIGAVVFLNAGIGFLQEYKAEKMIQALKNMLVLKARVYRDGHIQEIPAKELVPGDVIFVEEGDKIPADARVIQAKNLRSVEGSLTGESAPVTKLDTVVSGDTPLGDRKNMLWMGTLVASGSGRAIVTATGRFTALGSIAHHIGRIKESKNHFQEKVSALGLQMGLIAIFGATLTFVIGFFFRQMEFSEIFFATVATLVSGIPEGLPAVLTIVLAISAMRMAKKNAVVRTLSATETLGVVTTIMTDKTGTLTQNILNVRKVYGAQGEEFSVSGEGWSAEGNFVQGTNTVLPLEHSHLAKLLHIAGHCNSAEVIKNSKTGEYSIIGDPTEAALDVLAKKAGITKEILRSQETLVEDVPFNSADKFRMTLVDFSAQNKREIYVVGAPEILLSKSTKVFSQGDVKDMQESDRARILDTVNIWSQDALRVIGIAYRETTSSKKYIEKESIHDLVFVGCVGMIDAPRKEVPKAVSQAKEAGIRTIMTTGDHKETALAIAREVGITSKEKSQVYTQSDLEKMNTEQFEKALQESNVFARLTPKMKLRIVETLQRQGEKVAVTGDGVNDALALKKADIGVSMGRIGTDIARESSDIVLTDDNFASIVHAIEEGRIVFNNARRSSSFLITTNFAEHVTIVSALGIGLPLPLIPTQILWLNLVTEGLPDIALATEPSHGAALKSSPRSTKEGILSWEVLPFVILMSVVMAVLSIFVFLHFLPEGLEKARSGVFAIMAWTQLFNALNMRSLHRSVFAIGFFRNKFLWGALIFSVAMLMVALYMPFFQNIFHFGVLTTEEFLVLMGISSIVLVLGEGYKFIKNKFS